MKKTTIIKNIVITGAGSGIGKETAKLFLNNGYRVALIGRKSEALIKTANNNINAMILPCDVSDYTKVNKTFLKIYKKYKRIDILFNNAGISKKSGTIDEISVKDWTEVVNINLLGSYYCAREVFKIMRLQKPQGGRIINNGSISSHSPRPLSSSYTSTKHAITGLTKSISLDGRKFNIACCQIDIGNAKSNLTRKMPIGIKQASGLIKKEPTFKTKHVAKSILHISELPLDVNIQFMTIMSTKMPYIGRG